MHDILELPEVRKQVSRLSVSEYHQLGEFNENGRGVELIRGIILTKMAKSPLHASIASVLAKALFRMVPESFSLRIDNPLTLADSEPEPDLAVVRGSERDYFGSHPATAELVLEIAVTSLALDREKAPLYAEAGVQDYWIILAELREVEVHRRPEGGQYREVRTYARGETVECACVPEIRVELAKIFPD